MASMRRYREISQGVGSKVFLIITMMETFSINEHTRQQWDRQPNELFKEKSTPFREEVGDQNDYHRTRHDRVGKKRSVFYDDPQRDQRKRNGEIGA